MLTTMLAAEEEMAAQSLPPDKLAQYMDIDVAILEDNMIPGGVETPCSKQQHDSDDDDAEEEDERPYPKKKSKKAKKKQQKLSEEAEEPGAKMGTGKKKKESHENSSSGYCGCSYKDGGR